MFLWVAGKTTALYNLSVLRSVFEIFFLYLIHYANIQ